MAATLPIPAPESAGDQDVWHCFTREGKSNERMASTIETVEYICDQAGLGRRLTFRKMFGEYALYVDGKVTALVCDNQLFLKDTAEGRAYLGTVTEACPYPGARKHLLLTGELDDPEQLGSALQITARALPEPKPKRARTSRAKR
jgi:TfoX/Sxy family transcriptional regulator of competence genes